jgi:hypothetical protein
VILTAPGDWLTGLQELHGSLGEDVLAEVVGLRHEIRVELLVGKRVERAHLREVCDGGGEEEAAAVREVRTETAARQVALDVSLTFLRFLVVGKWGEA